MGRWIVWILAGCLILSLSCSKEDQEPLATFNFTINNGQMIQWQGPGGPSNACLLCGPQITQSPTYFTLSSSPPDNSGRSIILTFTSPEVNVSTYTETIGADVDIDPFYAPHVLYLDPLRGASTQEGDYARVTFTKVRSGGFYDGNFEARITRLPYGPEDEKLEIKGEFRNVILYK